MNTMKLFALWRIIEAALAVAALAIFANIVHPSNSVDLVKEISLSFIIVATFYLLSGYILISLIVSASQLSMIWFAVACVFGYSFSVFIFLVINPVSSIDAYIMLAIGLALSLLSGLLSKKLLDRPN